MRDRRTEVAQALSCERDGDKISKCEVFEDYREDVYRKGEEWWRGVV